MTNVFETGNYNSIRFQGRKVSNSSSSSYDATKITEDNASYKFFSGPGHNFTAGDTYDTSFYISGPNNEFTGYVASGMTWEEFVNTVDSQGRFFTIEGTDVLYKGSSGSYAVKKDSVKISKNDVILGGGYVAAPSN